MGRGEGEGDGAGVGVGVGVGVDSEGRGRHLVTGECHCDGLLGGGEGSGGWGSSP